MLVKFTAVINMLLDKLVCFALSHYSPNLVFEDLPMYLPLE